MKHKFFLFLTICLIISTILLTGCSPSDLKTPIGDVSINRVESVKEFMGQKPKSLTDNILLIYFDSKDDIETTSLQYASLRVFVSDSRGNEYRRVLYGSELGDLSSDLWCLNG